MQLFLVLLFVSGTENYVALMQVGLALAGAPAAQAGFLGPARPQHFACVRIMPRENRELSRHRPKSRHEDSLHDISFIGWHIGHKLTFY
jgi:hypothetical protein